MIFYAHRGNLQGRNPERENTHKYIDEALAAGFHVEVDVRLADRGGLYLGHDSPKEILNLGWLSTFNERLLLHAKNLGALWFLEYLGMDLHCFAHAGDAFVYTSHKRVWLHDIKPGLTDACIVPLLDLSAVEAFDLAAYPKLYGICSDYVLRCRQRFQPSTTP